VCSFGNVTVTDSTLSNNVSGGGGDGGGVCAHGNLTAINSTVTRNTATGQGGGLDTNGDLTLVYATVVQNTAPTGANLGFLTFAAFGSAVALPQGGGANCSGPGTTNGFNFTDDSSCGFGATETHPGVDPGLGALTNNGGPTQTQLPQPGSPLLDTIPVAHCSDDGAAAITPLVDQRGVTRPRGAGCDVGAVEVQTVTPAPIVIIPPRFTG
jgi:predicted outer membrane repeat protein